VNDYSIKAYHHSYEIVKRKFSKVTQNGEPVISVDDLEVAQFIYLLLNHQKLRNVLNTVTQRGVLLLGRFGDGGLEVLQTVAARLREQSICRSFLILTDLVIATTPKPSRHSVAFRALSSRI
jgi:hypothetical protein